MKGNTLFTVFIKNINVLDILKFTWGLSSRVLFFPSWKFRNFRVRVIQIQMKILPAFQRAFPGQKIESSLTFCPLTRDQVAQNVISHIEIG